MSTREIQLANERGVALVNANDYACVSQYKWHLSKEGFAKRMSPRTRRYGPRKPIYMHREILGAPAGTQVWHIDGNRLNNTRANLRIFTSDESRFWAKVKKSAGCWIWTGSRDPKGYGTFCWHSHGRARTRKTHRISYEMHYGPIRKGLSVCHSCDNPSCVNPAHLWLGTNAENAHDKKVKGRARNTNTTKTHCKRGHEFTPDNTAIDPRGARVCVACRRAKGRARYARASNRAIHETGNCWPRWTA